uniref:ARID domain-containing protein n=1 Tax=Knipowitschia caucasica TaxID=637954 RepID=A0AAV2IRP3_KNICA
MGDQRPTEMDREDRGRRPSEDIAEEQFLKDLYIFMSKRDTPIERLPHLGFKQLDLYLMYKTAKEMGGYHQVTAQQLWKQVYNALGGNPRSTSAATCTRRHYEKLLLPYECHVKGLCLSAVQQPRHYRYVTYRKMDDDGPPLKRRPPQYPLQNPLGVMPEHNSGYLPLSPSYHKFYYPSFPYPPLPQAPLPPPQLIAPRPPPPPPPPPQPQPLPPPPSYPSRTPPLPSPMECPPPIPISPESQVNPLEHLRYLAKQYENSAGFSEPLDLSKPLTRDVVTNPKNALSREFNLCGDVREPCNDKSQGWDLTSRGGLSLSRLVTPNPTSAPQDLRASRPKGGQQSQPEPISVLQLTPDEVMKLKRIISNSSCH